MQPVTIRGPYIDWVARTDLFGMIVKAVEGARSFEAAVKSLRKPSNPEIFDQLSRSTVRGWFDADFRLKKDVRLKWEAGMPRLGGIGASYSLADHAPLEQFLIEIFRKRRESGLVVNSNVAVPIMRSVIKQRAPQLLDDMALSRRWVRQWLRTRCGFTYKKAIQEGDNIRSEAACGLGEAGGDDDRPRCCSGHHQEGRASQPRHQLGPERHHVDADVYVHVPRQDGQACQRHRPG
jgi:hypothetical protein